MGNEADSHIISGEAIATSLPRFTTVSSNARKVFIGIPAYWSVDPHFHQACIKAFSNLDTLHGMVMHSFGDSPNVGRSRNCLTRQFLESDCTDLLFIDSDLIFSAEHIERIMTHEDEVVGGIYFKKQEGRPAPCINHCSEPEIRDNGLIQVAYIGTGFLRIRRSVFEKMIDKFGEDIWYRTDGPEKDRVKEHNFWHLGIYQYPNGDRRWLSEDWWFCQRCKDLNIPVWADRRIILSHSGHAIYPLSYQRDEILVPGGKDNFTGSGQVATVDKAAGGVSSPTLPAATI